MPKKGKKPRGESINLESARPARSRLDRPCDLCRRHKHMCMLPVRGEPCVSCKTRDVECTFDIGPSARKRKRKESLGLEPGEDLDQQASIDDTNVAIDNVGLSLFQQDIVLPSPLPTGTINSYSTSSLGGGPGPSTLLQIQRSLGIGQSGIRDEPLSQPPPQTSLPPIPGVLPTNIPNVHNTQGLSTFSFDRAETDISPVAPSAGWSDGVIEEPIVHPPSLDLEDALEQESHFLGSGAFASLGLGAIQPPATSGPTGTLSFRQVSSDLRHPVFFVKNPSLLYGRTQNTGQVMFDASRKLCDGVGKDLPSACITRMTRLMLPAIPIINAKRLETSCLGLEGSGPVPYALLTGIIAHAVSYVEELRPLHNSLWRQTLLALDDEYRLPRLSTLQLALLVLYSRPGETGENAGQLSIGLSRAVGAAHLLGLHMDPTNWMLPRWEICLRKRIWWALMIQDKWRALLYGRPSNVNKQNHRVSLPTVDDGDWGRWASPADRTSLESFIATCKLTAIIDDILDKFYSVDALYEPLPPLTRIATIEHLIKRAEMIEADSPPALRLEDNVNRIWVTPPSGVRSYQLSYLGLLIILHRLLFEGLAADTSYHGNVLLAALRACQSVISFIESLNTTDQGLFWTPISFHHISNTVSLLLRLAMRARSSRDPLESQIVERTTYFVSHLVSMYKTNAQWDIAGLALRRISALLLMAEGEISEMRETYRNVAMALGIPIAGETNTTDDFLASLGLTDFDPLGWMGNDHSWLSSFGGLLDGDGSSSGVGLGDGAGMLGGGLGVDL